MKMEELGYSPAQVEHLQKLAAEADRQPQQMAVVDYLGFRDSDHQLITVVSPESRRFGVRSMAHVAVYGFKAVYLNPVAREAAAREKRG